MAVGSLVGCSFCLDLGYFMAHNEGLDEAKVREVPRWREWDAFTPLERDVMRYAEAMSQAPPTVTDEMSARLLEKVTIHRSQVRNSRSHRPATRGRLASAGTARPVVGTTVYAARRRPVW